MRPPRIAILVLFFASSLFLFCRSVVSLRSTQAGAPLSPTSTTTTKASTFGSFFSFNTPFTLFPPNAAISLTDDNSTFFSARPAAFGPPLPLNGLSGPLWIGSGFADENVPDGEGEGELGCSDLPGWGDGHTIIGVKGTAIGLNAKANAAPAADKEKSTKRSKLPHGPPVDLPTDAEAKPKEEEEPLDDGTDDYLHRSLRAKSGPGYEMTTVTSSHADIQSIQETAEITGKVVLLSRGGCGFLEKVKWAQRRGAISVIVGDNQKGGPLIQMFARGDTSNITIPATFTSRTTAYLLSALMQPGSFIEDLIDEDGNPTFKVQPADKTRKSRKTNAQKQTTSVTAKAKSELLEAKAKVTRRESSSSTAKANRNNQSSWLSRMFGWGGSTKATSDRSRPPSSGQHDWVLVNDWNDERDKVIRNSMEKAAKKGKDAAAASPNSSGDGFRIGVQDWRDPDLVDTPATGAGKAPSTSKDAVAGRNAQGNLKATMEKAIKESAQQQGQIKDLNGPKGGSVTPGSGQYVPQSNRGKPYTSKPGLHESSSNGLISTLFGDDDDADFGKTASKTVNAPSTKQSKPEEPHEGLWVTISPTGSTAPFFDTLLVLVVSPLITLTVVYALLILRAKIRRRRWRAPKSVVERLPVRTYHTVAPSSSRNSRIPSPTSSSPTTPLLQDAARPRPRSRTATGVPNADDLLRVDTALQGSRSPSRASEKKPSEWKKYMGRQVECVVCLEEYIDGVSRVMSLPCGHEFHADTPWLTTRRRTCPICKGDVVRSLARGSPSSPRYEAYHDDSDDDGIEPIASGSGQRSPDQFADVEQGIVSPTPRRSSRGSGRSGWLGLLSSGLGPQNPGSPSRSSRLPEEDRDR